MEARTQAAGDTEDALDTFQDYELGEAAAAARLAELEGLYRRSHAEPRLAVLLARAWNRVSFEFILDAHEQALELGDKPNAAYHLARARAGFERAMYFADSWLGTKDGRFAELVKVPAEFGPYLSKAFGSDSAGALLFGGVARVGYASTSPDPAHASNVRRVGRMMLERAEILAPSLLPGLADLFI
ncbi:MAG TPA: TRAP transporter TatT component family protein, partial [Polyangiaceae bacterium]|nr:TRAP transporter TatT component family protein [Polyangiaceae bacterium]